MIKEYANPQVLSDTTKATGKNPKLTKKLTVCFLSSENGLNFCSKPTVIKKYSELLKAGKKIKAAKEKQCGEEPEQECDAEHKDENSMKCNFYEPEKKAKIEKKQEKIDQANGKALCKI